VLCGSGTILGLSSVVASGTFEMQGTYNTADCVLSNGTAILNTASVLDAITISGGTLFADNHGTVTTLNANGGIVDWTRTNNLRTITNAVTDPGEGRTSVLRFDTGYTAFTNGFAPTKPVRLSSKAI
jgi:hypothetical protein